MRRRLIKHEHRTIPYILTGDQLITGEKVTSGHQIPYRVDISSSNPVQPATDSGSAQVWLDNRQLECQFSIRPTHIDLLVDGFYYKMEKTALFGGAAVQGNIRDLRTEIPGRIIKVLVKTGQVVDPGAPLIVQEAMKMEMQLKAPAKLKITEILVTEGLQVEADAILMRFEPADEK